MTYSPWDGTVRVLRSPLRIEPVGSLTKTTEVGSRLPSGSLSLLRIFIVIAVSSGVLLLSSIATGKSLTSSTVRLIMALAVAPSSSATRYSTGVGMPL